MASSTLRSLSRISYGFDNENFWRTFAHQFKLVGLWANIRWRTTKSLKTRHTSRDYSNGARPIGRLFTGNFRYRILIYNFQNPSRIKKTAKNSSRVKIKGFTWTFFFRSYKKGFLYDSVECLGNIGTPPTPVPFVLVNTVFIYTTKTFTKTRALDSETNLVFTRRRFKAFLQ